ncbi:MAG: cyclic nucleotide-binding domain-containing protein [Microscillaceae bacterium]|jgi:CRP-like cAMP-binding protein|nr:cyclic nucleotide-binding domain-containing protein [Microscillaceae bacterium]
MNLFARTYSKSELDLFDFLSKNKLFGKLTHKEMSLFLPYMHLRMYKQDEVVFFRGDPSQALYLIKEGRISLELDMGEKFETVVQLQQFASFGNNSLLPKTRRIFNAFVISPFCQLYVVPQVNIQHIFESKPIIKAKIMESLAEVYNDNLGNLCKTYRSVHGFFELGEMFKEVVYGI